MARIIITHPWEKTFEARAGLSLLEALCQAGIEITSPCGGKGICGKCQVRFKHVQGQKDTPSGALSDEAYQSGLRLACQTVLDAQARLKIALLDNYCLDSRILEGEHLTLTALDPAVRLIAGPNGWRMAYQGLADNMALKVWKAQDTAKGLAVDLGTTTLVATLMDLNTGTESATESCINPQTRFGHDVMSRIDHAGTPQGLHQAQQAVVRALDTLIRQACQQAEADANQILDVVIGGNTAMLQILAGIDPRPLGYLPFKVDLEAGRTYAAGRFGLRAVNPAARVYLPPLAHAFVGADISAGLLAVDFFKAQDGPCLFVDIGTNSEMALNTGDRLVATSTAAGPAFEGMGISCGTRAAAGAVEMVQTNGHSYSARTIDDAAPIGICGSGILDTMACMLQGKVIDHTGRMARGEQAQNLAPALARRLKQQDGKPVFEVAPGVFLTQKDVRQFQLAKSAIQSGMLAMLEAVGMAPRVLQKIIIAGAFGYHLRKESLKTAGITPKGFEGEIVFAGNTCRLGCAQMLVNSALRSWLESQMRRLTHLKLAGNHDFQTLFVKNMWF